MRTRVDITGKIVWSHDTVTFRHCLRNSVIMIAFQEWAATVNRYSVPIYFFGPHF